MYACICSVYNSHQTSKLDMQGAARTSRYDTERTEDSGQKLRFKQD